MVLKGSFNLLNFDWSKREEVAEIARTVRGVDVVNTNDEVVLNIHIDLDQLEDLVTKLKAYKVTENARYHRP